MGKDRLILDGGLATELERAGYDLDHPLWSAKLLLEDREAIKKVHRSYLEAGAECIITASYQISYPGCSALGIPENETTELLKDSVRVAIEAVREFGESAKSTDFAEPTRFVSSFGSGESDDQRDIPKSGERDSLDSPEATNPANSANSVNSANSILVAASIGPYGAYLADGSEYTGNYGLSKVELRDFHARRFDVLAATDADILVCETIPCLLEAEVLLELLEFTPSRKAWFSFSCQDSEKINDGTPISECASLLASSSQVEAVGINCTAPQHISNLIKRIRKAAPSKTIVVYPNSGESYDAVFGTWHDDQKKGHTAPGALELASYASEWFALGARIIGGCCRTGPEDIKKIREELIVPVEC